MSVLNYSHIVVTKNMDNYEQNLKQRLPINSIKMIKNPDINKTNFKIEQANEVIKEANISTKDFKYIVLSAQKYEIQAQNSILKILEEPPKNIVFIIITNLKTALLPTVLSRLPVVYDKTKQNKTNIKQNIHRMDIQQIYSFLEKNRRATKEQAKEVITNSLFEIKSDLMYQTNSLLDIFEKSLKLLELNSRPINILTLFCLSLFMEKKSASI
ncbi:MAG: DNA polymerase III subunit delta' [Epsilonproteobacteria bacterium]|nr:MAG: DNA polymerase III subunit delta' [Campylobacterota bacterium]